MEEKKKTNETLPAADAQQEEDLFSAAPAATEKEETGKSRRGGKKPEEKTGEDENATPKDGGTAAPKEEDAPAEEKKPRKKRQPKTEETASAPEEKAAGIHSIIATLQKTVTIRKKEQKDETGRVFLAWTIDDILAIIKPLYLELGAILWFDDTVTITDKVPYVNTVLHFMHVESGEEITIKASAREDGHRPGYHAPQLSGTASTYAHKVAIKNLLALAEPGEDPDQGVPAPVSGDGTDEAAAEEEKPEAPETPAAEKAPKAKTVEQAPAQQPQAPSPKQESAPEAESAEKAPAQEERPEKEKSELTEEEADDAKRQRNITIAMWIRSQRNRGCNDATIIKAIRDHHGEVDIARYDYWLSIVGLSPDGSAVK